MAIQLYGLLEGSLITRILHSCWQLEQILLLDQLIFCLSFIEQPWMEIWRKLKAVHVLSVFV